MRIDELLTDQIARHLPRVRVLGIRGAKTDDVEGMLSDLRKLGQFQLMDAGLILSEEHARFASFEAIRRWESGESAAASLPMEILLRAACTAQIAEAISRLGVRRSSREVVLVAVDASEAKIQDAVKAVGGEVSASVLEDRPARREKVKCAFGLGEPVEKTLIESIALSSVR